jgi:hypothetical protein
MRTARSLLSAQLERVVARSHLGLAFGAGETVASSALIVAAPLAGLLYRASPTLPFPVSLVMIAAALLVSIRFLPADPEGRTVAQEPMEAEG